MNVALFTFVLLLNASQLARMKNGTLTRLYYEIYRDEAVGLKSCKYRPTLKITIFVNMKNLGQFRENLIFCQNYLIEDRIYKFFCIRVTHII